MPLHYLAKKRSFRSLKSRRLILWTPGSGQEKHRFVSTRTGTTSRHLHMFPHVRAACKVTVRSMRWWGSWKKRDGISPDLLPTIPWLSRIVIRFSGTCARGKTILPSGWLRSRVPSASTIPPLVALADKLDTWKWCHRLYVQGVESTTISESVTNSLRTWNRHSARMSGHRSSLGPRDRNMEDFYLMHAWEGPGSIDNLNSEAPIGSPETLSMWSSATSHCACDLMRLVVRLHILDVGARGSCRVGLYQTLVASAKERQSHWEIRTICMRGKTLVKPHWSMPSELCLTLSPRQNRVFRMCWAHSVFSSPCYIR